MATPRNLDAHARKVAKRYGIPAPVFLALGTAESGRQHTRPDGQLVVSPAGALGWGQLMPETAKGLGVDPTDPLQNIEGAAKYLSQQFNRFGTWKKALAAYNAGPGRVEDGSWQKIGETTNYVSKVLGLAGDPDSWDAEPKPERAVTADTSGASAPIPGVDLDALTQSVLAANEQIAQGDYDPVAASADLVQTLATTRTAPEEAAPSPGPGNQGRANPQDDGSWHKWVDTSDKRSGPSAPHRPETLQFVAQIGRMAGKRLKVWGNESHSLTTVDGKPSHHATGMAADIPATGLELIRLGRLALIAAGMDPKQAAKAKGGVYNVGRYNILFATDVGGNHHGHVHVGLRS